MFTNEPLQACASDLTDELWALALCANIPETTTSSFISVEGEEEHLDGSCPRNAGRSWCRNTAVPEKAQRRRFDAAYKLPILKEADRLTGPAGLLV